MVALFKIQDHGIVPDGSEEMTKSQHELYRRALTQELSRHAAVILRGTNTGKSFPLIWFFFKVLYAYNGHVFFFLLCYFDASHHDTGFHCFYHASCLTLLSGHSEAWKGILEPLGRLLKSSYKLRSYAYFFYPLISSSIDLCWSPMVVFFGILCWTVNALVLHYGLIFIRWIIKLQVCHLRWIDSHIGQGLLHMVTQ